MQCRHPGCTDADVEPCSKCGNRTCRRCRVNRRGATWCVECWNEASERESAREEAGLAKWRCSRP
jgi:hypothetical protein